MECASAASSTARYAPVPLVLNVLTAIPSAPINFLAILSASITASPALISSPAPSAQLATPTVQELTSAY